MISILGIWLYIFLLSSIYGIAIPFSVCKLLKIDPPRTISWTVSILLGLGLLTTLASLFSLVIKTGLVSNLILVIAAVVIVLSMRGVFLEFVRIGWQNLRRLNPATWLLFAAIFLVAWMKAVQVPQNYDTGLYHAQAIRWIETYPTVPGLGNLQDRLAFNSSWLLTSALFSFSFLGLQSFHALGAFLVIIVAAYLVFQMDSLLHGEITLSGIAAIVGLFFLRRIFSLEFSSPGTDLPAALLIWIIFFLGMKKIEKHRLQNFDSDSLAILILSAFVLTIKLSVIPVILISVYFLILQKGRSKIGSLAFQGGLALFILAPWLARNVILSGYLVYPVSGINIFNMDWKIPLAQAQETAAVIKSWAMSASADTAVLAAPISSWLPAWYARQDPADVQLLWAMGLGSLLLIVFTAGEAIWKKTLSLIMRQYWIFYAVALVGLLYWFEEAPAIRFAYGFIGVWLCLVFAPLAHWIVQHSQRLQKFILYAVIAGLVLYQGVGIFNLIKTPDFRQYLVLPADYPQVPTLSEQVDRYTIYAPAHGNQCWYAAFPCIPVLGNGFSLRGSTLENGFRTGP
jgi:hypothetical protein